MKKTRLVAISGKIGSGKNTVATIMQLLLWESVSKAVRDIDIDKIYANYDLCNTSELQGICSDWDLHLQMAFARKLKAICAILIGEQDASKLENAYFKSSKLPVEWDNPEPMTVRQMLQIVGTGAMRDVLHPNVWVNALFADYKEDSKWIITDMRFPNEFAAVKERGGICIRVDRDACEKSDHLSETALDNYVFDFKIINNGTIHDLIDSIYEVFKEIS